MTEVMWARSQVVERRQAPSKVKGMLLQDRARNRDIDSLGRVANCRGNRRGIIARNLQPDIHKLLVRIAIFTVVANHVGKEHEVKAAALQ